MQTLHNLLGARKAKFAQISSCAKEIVYARVCLRCWNISVRFYKRCERLLPLRVVGKYASNHLFPREDWKTVFMVFSIGLCIPCINIFPGLISYM